MTLTLLLSPVEHISTMAHGGGTEPGLKGMGDPPAMCWGRVLLRPLLYLSPPHSRNIPIAAPSVQ